MNALDALDRVAGRGESLGAVGFQRFRLGRVAVPHVDVLAVVEHVADEAGAHQAGAAKCDSHGVLLRSAPIKEKCGSATGGYWGEYCAKGPGRSRTVRSFRRTAPPIPYPRRTSAIPPNVAVVPSAVVVRNKLDCSLRPTHWRRERPATSRREVEPNWHGAFARSRGPVALRASAGVICPRLPQGRRRTPCNHGHSDGPGAGSAKSASAHGRSGPVGAK